MRAAQGPRGLLLAALLLAACQGTPRPVPAGSRPIPDAVRAARLALRIPDTAGALARLEADRALEAREPERSWLLAHLWRERGQEVRARRAADALPHGAFREALRASLARTPEEGLARLRRAGRGSPYLDLAASYLHAARDEEDAALARARAAETGGGDFVRVEALLVRARVHLAAGRLADARRAADAALAVEPAETRAWGLAAEASRRSGDLEGAADRLLGALVAVPASPGYARLLADLLRERGGEALGARVALRLAQIPRVETRERLALEGLLRAREGRVEAALALYERALARGANPVPVDRELRRICFATGRYARGVDLLLDAVPADVREDPRNLIGPAWRALAAARHTAADATAPAAARRALADALAGVGALREADHVLALVQDAAALAVRQRLGAEIAFEDAFEALLVEGYRRGSLKQDPEPFRRLLARLADVARRVLGPDAAGAFASPAEGLREMPLLGAWLDHGTDTASPVVSHFRRTGRYLVLGQRAGEPPEAILLSLASLTRAEEIVTRGHRLRHDVAVGYDRRLGSFRSAEGGGLGGACLPDAIWLDADEARESHHRTLAQLDADPGARALAAEAAAETGLLSLEGPWDLDAPGGIATRLLVRSQAVHGPDPWAGFDTLRAHESGHLVELERHLPIVQGLPATLALLVETGLSPFGLEAELERRAQLAAVAEARDAHLALAELVAPLPAVSARRSVHDEGYRLGTLALVRHIASHPECYPQIDTSRRILPQLDRLSEAQIRRAARAVLPR